jgi:ribonuclease HII
MQGLTLAFELAKFKAGFGMVVGVDEVGRGAFAGPVVACAIGIVPKALPLDGVHDSKRLTRLQRERLAPQILAQAAYVKLGVVESSYVDGHGIVGAVDVAMALALEKVDDSAFIIVDGLRLPQNLKREYHWAKAKARADATCYSVAAASIVAKVWRDAYMRQADSQYPGYGFKTNVGYGTAKHRRAISLLGFTPLHRCSFYHV